MPDVTPIYNWPIPEDTDLVKDGASAIRNLAGAVETTVDSLPNDAGLVHIETVDFSAVSSQSFDDVFSADYDNYRILFYADTSSTAATINLRFRVSATDATTGYNQTGFFYTTSATAHSRITNSTGTSILVFANTGTSAARKSSIDIFNPFATEQTDISALGLNGLGVAFQAIGTLSNSTSYTGFTFFPSTGTMTGKISVYGYRKN